MPWKKKKIRFFLTPPPLPKYWGKNGDKPSINVSCEKTGVAPHFLKRKLKICWKKQTKIGEDAGAEQYVDVFLIAAINSCRSAFQRAFILKIKQQCMGSCLQSEIVREPDGSACVFITELVCGCNNCIVNWESSRCSFLACKTN